MSDRPLNDILAECLRRHRYGLMRPLWADHPDDALKQEWIRDADRFLSVLKSAGLVIERAE